MEKLPVGVMTWVLSDPFKAVRLAGLSFCHFLFPADAVLAFLMGAFKAHGAIARTFAIVIG
jgi:hypothetical protein